MEENARAERNMQHAREQEEDELTYKLLQFYSALKVDKTHNIGKLAQDFRGNETVLNSALRAKYGKDLETCQIHCIARHSMHPEASKSKNTSGVGQLYTRETDPPPT